MPINIPQFNQLNIPAALQAGTKNALGNIAVQQAAQRRDQMNALAPMQLQNAKLNLAINNMKVISATAPLVNDQASYDNWKADLESKNVINPNTLPAAYSPDVMNKLIGNTKKALSRMPAAAIQVYDYAQKLPGAPKPSYKNFLDVTQPARVVNAGGQQLVLPGSAQRSSAPPAAGKEGSGYTIPVTLKPSQKISYKQKSSEASSAGQVTGKNKAQAQFSMPQTIFNAQQSIDIVNKLINSPGLDHITGWYSKAPIIPNTQQAEAKALMDQILGKQFMQAYQGLKGGGQITEVEGAKATEAISRMKSIAENGGSKKAFVKAANDYLTVIKNGLEIAKQQAGENQNTPQSQDQQAIEWAKQHPEDPRSAQILKINGIQ